ncbi:flagellar hook assembly protein FlgD [Oricola nitratireducens]|jgi:flagellar basal-body rod modification protein FlgD|uniref:flagellar hook assembly protein FlgD n=1 Tax=Oricola nitratireducens TaxID=2775868 RepID=UPI001868FB13|nr:flagellar hook assembly protein FlgD [Oricola nitratireducens]
MTVVTSATSTQSATAATGAKANVDYNSFLKLLVAELKNQDPTKPMDSTEYVAQLATFSNVEQGIQTNSKLDDLISMGHLQQAGSIIGRTLTTPDKSVTGTINEVRVFDDGIIAVLDSGEQVQVTSGVTIS